MNTFDKLTSLKDNFRTGLLKEYFRTASRRFKPSDEGAYVFEPEYFTDGEKIGDIRLNDDESIVIYSFKVKGELTERSSKRRQYEHSKKILRLNENIGYSGGIFVYHDDAQNFRFSFIYPEYKGTRREWSLYKRYTYYVGKSEPNRTFVDYVGSCDYSSIKKIREAFSVEKVTKEFYQKVVKSFTELTGGKRKIGSREINEKGLLRLPSTEDEKTKKNFAVRLIGRLLFCWFLKKKKSESGLPLLPEDILSSFAVGFRAEYYHNVVEKLFFEVLNTPIENRREEFRDGLWKTIPFLNGGLFEPTNEDFYRPDELSNSSYINTLRIPDKWFKDLFEVFERYNFTIDESSPIDVEVSIDPEMLGRIFENLLAEINPETGETARKSTGSYYTPREIVDYMVSESLFYYLTEKLRIDASSEGADKIRKLINGDSQTGDFAEDERESIVDALDDIRILDPACGSGAFPIGILLSLTQIFNIIDPKSDIWKRKHLSSITDHTIRQIIEEKIKDENWDFVHKIKILQKSIFGVDIQPIAVEISKLRCFLSLIVDENVDDNKQNRGIHPLPNLEFKFVCADTLIGLPVFKKAIGEQGKLGVDSLKMVKRLADLREKYLNTQGREKEKIKSDYLDIQHKIFENMIKWGSNSDEKETINLNMLSSWNPFDSTKSAEWFDPFWMFGVDDGFDIVIGNPPYIQLQKEGGKLADKYKDQNYRTFARTGDIYALFYEKGISLLREDGLLCYITSNKWMRAGYGEKLREFFTNYNPLILIDLGPDVFENATVDTNILLIEKSDIKRKKASGQIHFSKQMKLIKEREKMDFMDTLAKRVKSEISYNLRAVTITKKDEDETVDLQSELTNRGVVIEKLNKDAWFIAGNAEQRLKEKIERIGKPLKDWDVNIYRGVLTGLNEAFIITTEKRDEILANCRERAERERTEAIIKPILRGRDIKRYYYEWAGLWVIGTFPALNLDISEFPALKKYFLDNFDIRQLEQSGKKYPKLGFNARKKTGNKWFETQDQIAYYSEFEKEKVVWAETDQALNTVLVSPDFYLQKTCFMIITPYVKIVSALLNAEPAQWYIRNLTPNLGNKGMSLTKDSVQEIPIPPITSKNQDIVIQIERLVDKILAEKKNNSQADTSELERKIDQLVYKLYELTEEEVRMIESIKI